MAKKYKTSLKRKDVFFLDFDASKLVNAIEKAGGNIKPAIEKATRRSLPIIQKAFEEYIAKHRVTGETEASLIDASETDIHWGNAARKRYNFKSKAVEVYDDEAIMFFEYGFDIGKGGIVALYLDIGTPKREPNGQVKASYFIYYAVENNLSKVHAIQKEELTKILEGLQ